ncbi:putative alpha/Beta hydrolase [Plasmopara halstedii]
MKVNFYFIVAASTLQTSLSKPSETPKWYPCPMYSDPSIAVESTQVQCGKFKAPLCYSDVCSSPSSVNQTIELFVKLIPANEPETAMNIWMLGDQIGAASDSMEAAMVQLTNKLNGSVNIYTMDPRGSGRSTRLDCAVRTNNPLGYKMDPSQVASCAQKLERTFGNLAAFSPTSAAHDLFNLISKLSNGADTILYGTIYGALLVERVMHLAPPDVTGYVLDGPISTTGSYYYQSNADRDAGEVADAFMELCDQDRVCSSHFKDTLAATIQEIIDNFDNQADSPCFELMGSIKVNLQNASASSYLRLTNSIMLSTVLYTWIPQLVYRLKRCQLQDVKILKKFVKFLNAYDYSESPLYSITLQGLINYSEFWEKPTPSLAILKKRFTDSTAGEGTYDELPLYCAFSKEQSKACAKYDFGKYKAQGIIYKRDQYWNASVSIPNQASVLVLSSKLDMAAPHKYTQRLLQSLDGDNKKLISFDFGSGGTLSTTFVDLRSFEKDTCALEVLASYIRNNGDLASLDQSCLDKMPEFEMILEDFNADHLMTLINTTI